MKPSLNPSIRNTESLTKFGDASGYSTNRENSIVALVPVLLSHGLPLAICWLIITIIIFSAQCQFWGAFAHIGQKIREVSPSLTHGNTTPNPVFRLGSIKICATAEHRQPDTICSGLSSICRMSVDQKMRTLDFLSEAAARRHISGFYEIPPANLLPSTITHTKPVGMGQFSNYNKSSESAADDVYLSRHSIGLFNVVFSSGFRQQPDPLRYFHKPT